jgi:hypothetical protein
MADRSFDRNGQAQNDLLWTRDTIKAGRYSQAQEAAGFAEFIIRTVGLEFPEYSHETDTR